MIIATTVITPTSEGTVAAIMILFASLLDAVTVVEADEEEGLVVPLDEKEKVGGGGLHSSHLLIGSSMMTEATDLFIVTRAVSSISTFRVDTTSIALHSKYSHKKLALKLTEIL